MYESYSTWNFIKYFLVYIIYYFTLGPFYVFLFQLCRRKIEKKVKNPKKDDDDESEVSSDSEDDDEEEKNLTYFTRIYHMTHNMHFLYRGQII